MAEHHFLESRHRVHKDRLKRAAAELVHNRRCSQFSATCHIIYNCCEMKILQVLSALIVLVSVASASPRPHTYDSEQQSDDFLESVVQHLRDAAKNDWSLNSKIENGLNLAITVELHNYYVSLYYRYKFMSSIFVIFLYCSCCSK